jgi:hypothetical protein
VQRLEHREQANRSTAGYWRQAAISKENSMGTRDHPDHTGSGIDQPHKPNLTSRIIEKITQSDRGRAQEPEPEKDDAKARRIEQERTAFDLKHKPTERDAQIDGSGARFEVDG